MPGLHIDLSEEDYERIPRPKRTWVRDLVRAALDRGDRVELDPEVVTEPREYYFRVDGKVVHAMGLTPAEAAGKLGLGLTTDWRTEEEALRDGWMEVADPLDV